MWHFQRAFMWGGWSLNGAEAMLLCPKGDVFIHWQPAKEAWEAGHPKGEVCNLDCSRFHVGSSLWNSALHLWVNWEFAVSSIEVLSKTAVTFWESHMGPLLWKISVPNVIMSWYFIIVYGNFFHAPVLLVEVIKPDNETETWDPGSCPRTVAWMKSQWQNSIWIQRGLASIHINKLPLSLALYRVKPFLVYYFNL